MNFNYLNIVLFTEKINYAIIFCIEEFFMKLSKVLVIKVSILMFVVGTGIACSVHFLKNNEKTMNDSCVVSFNTMGGTEIETQKVNCGVTIEKPVSPQKQGFIFEGWYYGDNLFDFNNKVTKNIVLKAKYIAQENTEVIIISFDSNGGSLIDDIELIRGGIITPPIDPKMSEHTFLGWYCNGKEFDFSKSINENTNLIAKWKENKKTKNTTSTTSKKMLVTKILLDKQR